MFKLLILPLCTSKSSFLPLHSPLCEQFRSLPPLCSSFICRGLHNWLDGPTLDSLQCENIFLVWERPEVDTGLQMWSQQCWMEGHNHLPCILAAQGMAVWLHFKEALLTHTQFGRRILQTFSPKIFSACISILWRYLWTAAFHYSTLFSQFSIICWEFYWFSSGIWWQTISKARLLVKVYNIHCCPLIHRSGKLVGQLWFGKYEMVVPNISFFICLEMTSRDICSVNLPGTEVCPDIW